MRLKAFSDNHRVWIEDTDTDLDDPHMVLAHFRTYPGPNGLPKRVEKRLLAIAETMAAAVNRENQT